MVTESSELFTKQSEHMRECVHCYNIDSIIANKVMHNNQLSVARSFAQLTCRAGACVSITGHLLLVFANTPSFFLPNLHSYSVSLKPNVVCIEIEK